MKTTYYVYVHTCPDGKRYVGQTSNSPEVRWKEGFGYRTQTTFFTAIVKFGWLNIKHEIIKVGSREEMFELERSLIERYRTTDPKFGYNVSKGCSARDPKSRQKRQPLSPEERHKIRVEAGKKGGKKSKKNRARRVRYKGREYESIRELANAISKPESTIYNWLKKSKVQYL